ncbi:hypothetical protein IMW82_08575 [Rhodanobacter sp. B2A1Ga4]|uniref:hypothetical protein n=1 Tax=Rhodanobacter sp. B2A1Ga4 TaxID=2778647 RepID=UPI001B38A3D2|nr:hypothetical protein [Rhodanobacter sp. B2A1Ga4]MBQ4854724.1 hypothetical protein [Rhodanobacter sp. B2A1Ga4]
MSRTSESRDSFLLPSIDPAWRATVKALLLVGGMVFVVLCFKHLWVANTDMAHHYALISYLAEFWRPPVYAPNLGEMNFYPYYSHLLAALAGTFLHSPLMGMQLVTLLSVYALWVALAIALATLPARAATLFFVSFVVLLALNRFGLHAELFGSEVIVNFFFAELVAQALCAWVYTLMLLMERRGVSAPLRYAFCVIAIHFLVRTHLLPTVELFGALGLLIAMDVVEAPRQRRLWTILSGGITLLAGCAVIVLDPAFGALRKLSKNNGGLPLQLIPNTLVLAVLAVAVIVLSLVLAWQWMKTRKTGLHPRFLAYKYFACLGISVGALCLLQIALLKWGLGSEYACRKYAFALQTLALIELCLLVSTFLVSRNISVESPDGTRLLAPISYLSPVLMVLVGLWLGFIPRSGVTEQDAAHLVALERTITTASLTELEPIAGKSNYVVGIAGIPWFDNYLFSIGILKTPRHAVFIPAQFITGEGYEDPQRVGSILTSLGNRPLDIAACRKHTLANDLVILDGACVMGKFRSAQCEGIYDFSANGHLPTGMATGFSGPEPTGRWSAGPKGSVTCTFSPGATRPDRILIYAHGRVSAGPQRMLISVDGGTSQSFTYTAQNQPSPISVDISKAQGEKLTIEFEFPDEQPASTRDPRLISVFFHKIEFK